MRRWKYVRYSVSESHMVRFLLTLLLVLISKNTGRSCAEQLGRHDEQTYQEHRRSEDV